MSHRIGVVAGMNSQFLTGLFYYIGVVCIGVYFGVVNDFDINDQMTHTIIGALLGSSSTLFALVIVCKINLKGKKEIVK